jgi:DNA-binding CsgD family transcriptional regulator
MKQHFQTKVKESEIVRRLSEGQEQKEISAALGIQSTATNWHIRKIKEAHGAKTQAHLIAILFRQGKLS